MRVESGECSNSSNSEVQDVEVKSILNTSKKEDYELKSIYFLERSNLKDYLSNKFSHNYSREMFNTLEKIFVKFNVGTLNELKTLMESNKINQRAGRTSYRVFLNYLEEKEKVSEDILFKLRRKIK